MDPHRTAAYYGNVGAGSSGVPAHSSPNNDNSSSSRNNSNNSNTVGSHDYGYSSGDTAASARVHHGPLGHGRRQQRPQSQQVGVDIQETPFPPVEANSSAGNYVLHKSGQPDDTHEMEPLKPSAYDDAANQEKAGYHGNADYHSQSKAWAQQGGYGGAGVFDPNCSPLSHVIPLNASTDNLGSHEPTRGRSTAYPPRPGFANRTVSGSPVSGRRRQPSQDWGRLMKEAGYQTTQAPQGKGMGADITVKGPLSWLRSVVGASSILRWTFIIIPVLVVLWVPGLVAILAYDARPANNFTDPQVWDTGIFWWSCWLSAVWLGWFVCRAASGLLPRLFKKTVGNVGLAVEIGLQKWLEYIISCEFYVSLFWHCIVIYATWLTLIWNHHDSSDKASETTSVNPLASNSTSTTTTTTTTTDSDDFFVTVSRFFFGLIICSALLLAEKMFIQMIAYSFHHDTYADRLATSRFQVAVLTTLYTNSSTSLMRRDTVLDAEKARKTPDAKRRGSFLNPLAAAGKMAKAPTRFRKAAKSTGTVLGNVANELQEQKKLLSTSSPSFVVLSALESAKETRRLARRIFYSFAHKDPENPRLVIISPDHLEYLFPDATTCRAAFDLFDQDGGGTLTREELEASCLQMMHDRIALADSMHDVDSICQSLDSCFVSVYALIAAVIIAAMLSTKFETLVTSLGSVVLGLSWLFSSSAAEAFASVVFLIAKHPFDAGDRVDIRDPTAAIVYSYEVVELGLMATTFKDSEGKYVQIANSQLATRAIINHRRSGAIEEAVSLDVNYTTSLSQIESLRTRMVEWLDQQGREFRPGMNISIATLGDQSKLTLSSGIRYKSNIQDAGLRARRRNKWMCALRTFLEEEKIYGPSGDPGAEAPVTRVMNVTQDQLHREAAEAEREALEDHKRSDSLRVPRRGADGAGHSSPPPPPQYRLMDDPDIKAGTTSADLVSGSGLNSGYATGTNTPVRVQSPGPLPIDLTATATARRGFARALNEQDHHYHQQQQQQQPQSGTRPAAHTTDVGKMA